MGERGLISEIAHRKGGKENRASEPGWIEVILQFKNLCSDKAVPSYMINIDVNKY